MTARDEAIEAAAKEIVEAMRNFLPRGLHPVELAGDVLAASVPVLLNDLADRIEAEADTAFVGDAATIGDAIRLVRAAAEGWVA